MSKYPLPEGYEEKMKPCAAQAVQQFTKVLCPKECINLDLYSRSSTQPPPSEGFLLSNVFKQYALVSLFYLYLFFIVLLFRHNKTRCERK